MKQTIEIWTSNKGDEEVHHFIEGERNTYVFGINRKLLGETFYHKVLAAVQSRLEQVENSPYKHLAGL